MASFQGSRPDKKRLDLIAAGVIKEDNGRLVFQKDHLFSSPSLAATAVMARHANGWQAWIDGEGRPLDHLRLDGGGLEDVSEDE